MSYPENPTASDAGCWVDGHTGHYLSADVIRIAAMYGWQNTEAVEAANKYFQFNRIGEPFLPYDEKEIGDNAEFVYDVADEAVEWLNGNVAPEGYSFGFYEGEFFLWSEESWYDEYSGVNWRDDQ